MTTFLAEMHTICRNFFVKTPFKERPQIKREKMTSGWSQAEQEGCKVGVEPTTDKLRVCFSTVEIYAK